MQEHSQEENKIFLSMNTVTFAQIRRYKWILLYVGRKRGFLSKYTCMYACMCEHDMWLCPTFHVCLPSARRRKGGTLGCPRPERALLDRVTLNIRATAGTTRFPMPVSSPLASALFAPWDIEWTRWVYHRQTYEWAHRAVTGKRPCR